MANALNENLEVGDVLVLYDGSRATIAAEISSGCKAFLSGRAIGTDRGRVEGMIDVEATRALWTAWGGNRRPPTTD